MKKKYMIIAAAAVLIICLAAFMTVRMTSPAAKTEKTSEFAEAGKNVPTADLLKLKDKYSDSYSLSPKEEKADLTPPSAEVTYVLTGENGAKEFTVTFDVKDTKAPVIRQLKKTVKKNSKADVYSLIEVTDALDGKLEKKNITVSGKLDTGKKGMQEVTVKAEDAAGNTSEKRLSFNVVTDSADSATENAEPFMDPLIGVWMKNCSSKTELKKRIIPGIDASELGCIIISKKSGKYYLNDFELLGPEDNRLDFTEVSSTSVTANFTNSNFGKMKVTISDTDSSDSVMTVTLRGRTFTCFHTGAKTVEQYSKMYDE